MDIVYRAGGFVGNAISNTSRFFSLLAGIAILIIGISITYDVILRYILGTSTSWALEVSRHLVLLPIFLAAGYTLMKGGHVNIDLVITHLPERTRTILDTITSSAALVFCIIFTWQAWNTFSLSYRGHWMSWVTELEMALWPWYLLIPIGLFLLCLQLILRIQGNVTFLCQLKGSRPKGQFLSTEHIVEE